MSPYHILWRLVELLLRYGDLLIFFAKWWPSAILESSDAYWDHLRRVLCALYRCTKFGWKRCSSFDDMQVLIFCVFGLKIPDHTPKLVVLGTPKAHPSRETRHKTYRLLRSVHPLLHNSPFCLTPKIPCFTMLFSQPGKPQLCPFPSTPRSTMALSST